MRSFIKQFNKTLTIILSICLLVSCGFHLRGDSASLQGSLTSLAIKGKQSEITAEIKQLAERSKITIAPSAKWSIVILDEKSQSRRLSSTQSLSTDEFKITITVQYNIQHNDQIYGPINISRDAIFQDDQDQAASKSNEASIIKSELRQLLAAQILRRTQLISTNPPDCEPTDEVETTPTQ